MPPVFPIPGFTDPVSSLSHLLAFAVFAVLSVFLIRKGRGDARRQVALGLFALAVLFMFSMSGTYHLLPRETGGRTVLQRLDHASILVLIAASFTPSHWILFRGWLRWGVIALVWTIAATAIPLRVVFFDQTSDVVGLALYLGFGWIGVLSGVAVWRRYGAWQIAPLALGGLAYSIGAVVDHFGVPNPIPGVVQAHDLFHLFVIVGVSCHWYFFALFADGSGLGPRSSS